MKKEGKFINIISLFIISLLLNTVFLQLSMQKRRLNMLIVNYQGDCKFCFKSSLIPNKYSFTECPETLDENFRFSFLETKDKYTYTFRSKNNSLSIDSNTKFYMFPIFSDDRYLISLANNSENICLTNDLSLNNVSPFENDFSNFFSSCDYSGGTSSQVFIFENRDEINFRKITFSAYLINNPYHTNSNNLISQAEVDIINNNFPDYRIFFDSNVKYKVSANTFEGYLHPKINIQTFDWSWSSSSHRCIYPIHLRESAQKEFSFFNLKRCELNYQYSFFIDKLNKVLFKFKNITRNTYINSNLVRNNTYIYFNLTNQITNYPPDVKYLNVHNTISFEQFLEFSKYSISLTIDEPTYYAFEGLTPEINDCNYKELDIPIREKGATIVFKFLSTSTNTYINSSVLPTGSKIIIYNDDSPSKTFKYEYVIGPNVTSFSSFINISKNTIRAESSTGIPYNFVLQSFTVSDGVNSTIDILFKPSFFYKFDGNYKNEIDNSYANCSNCENLFFPFDSRLMLYFRNIGPSGLDYTWYMNGYQVWSGTPYIQGRISTLINSFSNTGFDNFSIKLEGLFYGTYEGFYKFRVCADDYAGVYFNRVLQLERLVYPYAPSCIDKVLYINHHNFYEFEILFAEYVGGENLSFHYVAPGNCSECWNFYPEYYGKRQSQLNLPSVDFTSQYYEKTLQVWISVHMHFGTIFTFRIYNNDRYIALDIDYSELRYVVKNDFGTFFKNTGIVLSINTWYHITIQFLSNSVSLCVHNVNCISFSETPSNNFYNDNIMGNQHYNTRHSLIFSLRNLIFYDFKIPDSISNPNISMP